MPFYASTMSVLKIYKVFRFLEKAVPQVLSDTVGISEIAITSNIATHDMSNFFSYFVLCFKRMMFSF